MYELTTFNQTMTSREIADYTGKRHADVLEAIRTMEPAWIKVNQRRFSLVEYTDAKGEQRPEFELTKMECLFITTKFNDITRAKLIKRWEELEMAKPNRLPSTKELAMMVVAAEEEKERLQLLTANQQKQIEVQTPKVEFYDKVIECSGLVTMSQVAKLLKLPFGRNTLYKRLREAGIFFKNRNEPMQQYVNAGLFELKETAIERNNHPPIMVMTTYVTQKGMAFIMRRMGFTPQQAILKLA